MQNEIKLIFNQISLETNLSKRIIEKVIRIDYSFLREIITSGNVKNLDGYENKRNRGFGLFHITPFKVNYIKNSERKIKLFYKKKHVNTYNSITELSKNSKDAIGKRLTAYKLFYYLKKGIKFEKRRYELKYAEKLKKLNYER